MKYDINEESKHAWKDNIAMSFYDAYCNYIKSSGIKHGISKKHIYKIANIGADNFLNLLIEKDIENAD